jgi:hypothetical protein
MIRGIFIGIGFSDVGINQLLKNAQKQESLRVQLVGSQLVQTNLNSNTKSKFKDDLFLLYEQITSDGENGIIRHL